jgi:hypothetical protein
MAGGSRSSRAASPRTAGGSAGGPPWAYDASSAGRERGGAAGVGCRRSRIATASPVRRIAAAAAMSTPTTHGAHGSAWCQKALPWWSTHCAAGGQTWMPLPSPPWALGFGHSPPQDNQSATAHTMSAETARRTAAPTVGPSRRLGLPLLTPRKLEIRGVGKRPQRNQSRKLREIRAANRPVPARWSDSRTCTWVSTPRRRFESIRIRRVDADCLDPALPWRAAATSA